MIKPKRLEKGDTIAFIAPSSGIGALCQHRIDNAEKFFKSRGFKVKEFLTTRRNVGGNGGTPEERVADIHAAFADKTVKAVICNIGGLAAKEILPMIDYGMIKANPKIFCGYSDISNFHYAFHVKADLVTFYGPAVITQFGEFPKPLEYTVDQFFKAVSGTAPIGAVRPSEEWTDEVLDWTSKEDLKRPRKMRKNSGYEWVRGGRAKGRIIGGCITSIVELVGTEFMPDHRGKILFIETPEGDDFSKGEPLDRIESHLAKYGKAVFGEIIGLVVGRGFGYSDEERERFKQMIARHTEGRGFPVLFNINIGHADPIMTIPLGAMATLDSEKNVFSIDEKCVA